MAVSLKRSNFRENSGGIFENCFLFFKKGEHPLDNPARPGGLVWTFLHFPLACALISNSVALKCFAQIETGEVDDIDREEVK